MGETMTVETADAPVDPEINRLKAEIARFTEVKATIVEELRATSIIKDVLALRGELKRCEDAIRNLNVKAFDLQQKIKRPIAARECKCPTCERFIPAGTILSDALKGALSKK